MGEVGDPQVIGRAAAVKIPLDRPRVAVPAGWADRDSVTNRSLGRGAAASSAGIQRDHLSASNHERPHNRPG